MVDRDPWGVQRRVAGMHNYRLDGLTDLLARCRGASVLDLGCNRGMVGMDFANNGASVVHGCDNSTKAIEVCREVFADLRSVQSQFDHADLTHGAESLRPFGDRGYDFVLLLATYHKIKRSMPESRLSGLIKNLGQRTSRYFAWRGTAEQHESNDAELVQLDKDLGEVGLKRVHLSYIATELGAAAIWARP